MAPLWYPFGRLVESFWLAFSAFERLEPQREPFQPRFYDLVSFLVPFRSNFVKSLRFLTELLKVVWFLSVYTFSSPCSPSYPSSPSFLASCLLATSGVRAQRSGARPLLAGCLDGWMAGWIAGWMSSPSSPLHCAFRFSPPFRLGLLEFKLRSTSLLLLLPPYRPHISPTSEAPDLLGLLSVLAGRLQTAI